jgi:hypothetical protein
MCWYGASSGAGSLGVPVRSSLMSIFGFLPIDRRRILPRFSVNLELVHDIFAPAFVVMGVK